MNNLRYRTVVCVSVLSLAACGVAHPPSDESSSDEPFGEAPQEATSTQGSNPQGTTYDGGAGLKVRKLGATMTINKVKYDVNNFRVANGKLRGTLSGWGPLSGQLMPYDGVSVNFQVMPIDDGVPLKDARITDEKMDTNASNLMGSCAHRTNHEDVHLYKIEWRESASAPWQNICEADDGWAVFTKGYWEDFDYYYGSGPRNHYHDTDAAAFGFSCLDGVTAKCMRWGYKEWQTLTSPTTNEPVQMKNLFLACQRAAMADYCSNGTSHTQENTTIDIWDRYDFIEQSNENATAWPLFADESSFDQNGPVCLEASRYASLPSECPDQCEVINGKLHCSGYIQEFEERSSSCGADNGREQLIFVDTGSNEYCPHEATTSSQNYSGGAKPMHKSCNDCTRQVCDAYPECCNTFVEDDAHKWTNACASHAQSMCTFVAPLPTHPLCINTGGTFGF